jgi:hypothetical protein
VKAGGRVFDVGVDIFDPVAGALVADLNHLTALEMQMEPSLAEVPSFLLSSAALLTPFRSSSSV